MRASRFAVHITTGNEVKVLVKTKSEMVKIANGIPDDWQNNDDQETYAAYLFESIDTENIINELPIKKDSIMANTTFVQVRVAQALKDEASNIYDYYGPDLPTAVRIFMKKTVVSLLIQGRRQCEIFS